jgi:hypothetical protein
LRLFTCGEWREESTKRLVLLARFWIGALGDLAGIKYGNEDEANVLLFLGLVGLLILSPVLLQRYNRIRVHEAIHRMRKKQVSL